MLYGLDDYSIVGALISLCLILASVALWFTGYNAVTSKYSVYATRELGFDYNLTLIIAQAAAIVSYIPVGIIASKIGRKKTILAGIIILASAFFIGNFITPTPLILRNYTAVKLTPYCRNGILSLGKTKR